MMEWSEILLRLSVATLACGAIGLNRDLHGKPIGLRTLGLVGLATAVVVIFAMPQEPYPAHMTDAVSRVVQGILTGCVGVICGAGEWRLVAVGLAIALLLLIFGGPLERLLRRLVTPGDPA